MRGSANTILVTGYAKAPQGTSMYEEYKYAGVVLEIDPDTDIIVDAESTFITDLAQRFFRRIVVGYCLRQGTQPIMSEFQDRYLAPSQQAVMSALKAAVQRYGERAGKGRD